MALSTPRAVAALIAVAVTGDAWAAESPCPSQEAIAAELQRLPGSDAAPLARSQVTVEGHTLRIVLRDSAGGVLGVREVEAPRECRQRAAVAAVVLAAWSHTWQDTAPPAAPPPPAPRRLAELALQGGAHDDGRRLAPGAAVLAGLQLLGPLGGGVVADIATGRDQDLGAGTVAYSVLRVGAGLVYRAERGTRWLDGGLFLQMVRVAVTPRDLPGARAAALWGGAAQARVRLGLSWRSLAPFLCVGVGRRFVRDRLTLDDDPGTTELPPWDVELGLGVALLFGRGNR